MWEWTFSSNKDQQRFINTSYRLYTVTVNYKRPIPKQLLHTIVSNEKSSFKEPIQLWVLVNEEIHIITNNETTTNIISKWHI